VLHSKLDSSHTEYDRPGFQINSLQRIHDFSHTVVKFSHITRILKSLHWLKLTRSSADADKLARRVWRQSRSTDMVPYWVHCGLSLHGTTRDSVGLPVSYLYYRATLCVSAVFAVARWRCPLSVTLVDCIQTAKDIFRLLSRPSRPIILVFDPQRRYPIQRGRKIQGYGKICDFRLKSPSISETVRDRPIWLLWNVNKKS